MKLNKTLYLLLTMGALTACGISGANAGEKQATSSDISEKKDIKNIKENTAEEIKITKKEDIRDLGGMNVVLAGWRDVNEPEIKKSSQDEALWEYRNDMMDTHNFTFAQKGMAGWNELLELMSTSTIAGDPAAQVFRIHVNFLEAAKNSGLCYDLATLDSIDVHDSKWGTPLTEKMTVGDSVYGLSPQENPLMCIYFNKRVFEEAGLAPDLLYELQASGEWTWEKFEEISDKITQDTDGDGNNDIHAINCNTNFFSQAAIFSNGGSFIGLDENGKYYNNMSSPETIAGLEWAKKYWNTDNEIIPEHWDGHRALFTSGKIGMYLAGSWEGVVFTQDLMPDDWGMVAFPKGPDADGYTSLYSFDAYVIPSSYTKEEAENITFAYDMWTNAAPGYDGPEDWKISLYPHYRDERVIEETLTMLRNTTNPQVDHSNILSGAGIVTTNIGSDIYFDRQTVKEAIESRKSQWQIEIDKINEANNNL
ncbi:hypothetical protein AN641_08365 [Candidatus Epulonipiscioides gigas]|nr:hypothetical protein AN641_08365 [Epulopiscium sp. SCG-C07WGA-EpuloA2]